MQARGTDFLTVHQVCHKVFVCIENRNLHQTQESSVRLGTCRMRLQIQADYGALELLHLFDHFVEFSVSLNFSNYRLVKIERVNFLQVLKSTLKSYLFILFQNFGLLLPYNLQI